jgi:hypothetical protein
MDRGSELNPHPANDNGACQIFFDNDFNDWNDALNLLVFLLHPF